MRIIRLLKARLLVGKSLINFTKHTLPSLLKRDLHMTGRRVCLQWGPYHRTSPNLQSFLRNQQPRGDFIIRTHVACVSSFSLISYVLPELRIHLLCSSGSPTNNGSSTEPSKRSKHSLQSKAFKVEISYAAKIPLKSLSLALKGAEIEYVQDALRVLDIILRQQAAKR